MEPQVPEPGNACPRTLHSLLLLQILKWVSFSLLKPEQRLVVFGLRGCALRALWKWTWAGPFRKDVTTFSLHGFTELFCVLVCLNCLLSLFKYFSSSFSYICDEFVCNDTDKADIGQMRNHLQKMQLTENCEDLINSDQVSCKSDHSERDEHESMTRSMRQRARKRWNVLSNKEFEMKVLV